MKSAPLQLVLIAATLGAMVLGGTACAPAVASARPAPFPGAPKGPIASRAGAADGVVNAALALRGTAYRMGGRTPATGFDCSGLVQYVFAQEAIDLPRTVAEQFSIGIRVGGDRVTAGDLVFFSARAGTPTHVGIAIDNERFIHAPDEGGVVRVERLQAPYWTQRLVGVRRVPDVN
jgi:cell wall-associated NlpC family hydrolase